MHIIVAGGGKTGRRLVHLFRNHRHYSVTVIDSEARKCEHISELFPYVDIVLGDVTHPSTLREAMGRKTEVFIAVTGEDHFNLLAAAAARKMGIARVIVRIIDPEYRDLAEVMGLDDVLDPADSLAAQVVTRMEGVDFADLIHHVYPTIEMVNLTIDADSDMVDVSPGDLSGELKDRVHPLVVIRGGIYQIPTRVSKLRAGDEVKMFRHR